MRATPSDASLPSPDPEDVRCSPACAVRCGSAGTRGGGGVGAGRGGGAGLQEGRIRALRAQQTEGGETDSLTVVLKRSL